MQKVTLTYLVFFSSVLHAAVDADDVREGLEHRWFDIEVIVFERLDTFEFNTVESLTSVDRPSWSRGFVSYDNDPPQSVSFESDLFVLDHRCVGFPVLPEALEPHPIIAAFIEAETIDAELDEQSVIDDLIVDLEERSDVTFLRVKFSNIGEKVVPWTFTFLLIYSK